MEKNGGVKKAFFNWLCEGYRAVECKNKGTCCNYNGKNHASSCCKSAEKQPSVAESHQKQPVMTIKERDLIYPVIVILVDKTKWSSGHRSYNQFHNILRLFDVLPNLPFTTSETMGDYYL